jgi:glutamine amidotransferase
MSDNISLLALKCSNWRSVNEALKLGGKKANILIPSEIKNIPENSICIIPGVGHISSLVNELNNFITLEDIKAQFKSKKIKVIGICLGFHFLCKLSHEDTYSPCLGLFNQGVEPLYHPPRPSVGWKSLNDHSKSINNLSHNLFELLRRNDFYFTHSYGAPLLEAIQDGVDVWTYLPADAKIQIAAVIHDDFIGFQFHPEKSGASGISLLSYSIDYLIESRNK